MNILVDPLLFLQFLREATGGIFNSFFLNATNFADFWPTLVILSIFYWCLDKKLGQYLLVSYGASNLLSSFLKVAAAIYRPWVLDSRIKPVKEALSTATGYSFPSGHSTNATAIFAGSVIRGNFSKIFNAVFILCLLLISFSRCYLGLHSILDVLFAIVSTIAILLLFNKLFDELDEIPNLDIIISVIGVILAILAMVYTLTKAYPMDYNAVGKLIVDPALTNIGVYLNFGIVCGIFFAWPLERRFVNFSSEGTSEEKIVRFAVGIIGLGILYTIILPFFGKSPWEYFLREFIIGLYIMLIYPAFIKFFQRKKSV